MANQFPSKETVDRLRKQYPERARVELISMEDPYSSLRPGEKGRVAFVDDTGTIHCDWDSGSHLGVVDGVDQVRRIENEIKYESGADFWHDTAAHHGLEEAAGICGRYLRAQLKTEDRGERQFCRELFAAMVGATAGRTDHAKLVYPYPFTQANERLEASYYHDSRRRNDECAKAIDGAISASCYAPRYYNLECAAMVAVNEFGFARVQAVLMSNIHRADYDGRYSRSNKDWAKEIDLPEAAIQRAILNAHPILVEDFTTHVRKFYDDLGAERFALPGREESGTIVGGYEITRSVRFDDRRGFAIGHNPAAVSPYVCWQFTTENGQRDFYWGTYADEFKGAADNYTARVAVHLSGGDIKEVENPLAATEMSTEQNYNMVDGLRNNMATPKADLTDGQTYEEVAELAPETLPREKPSVLAQIREAKKAQKKPSPKKTREKNAPDLER